MRISSLCPPFSFDSITLASVALRDNKGAFAITRREQVPLRLDCVFQFINVLRPRKLNTALDDRPEVFYFVQNIW